MDGIDVEQEDIYRDYYPVLPKLTFTGKFDTYKSGRYSMPS